MVSKKIMREVMRNTLIPKGKGGSGESGTGDRVISNPRGGSSH